MLLEAVDPPVPFTPDAPVEPMEKRKPVCVLMSWSEDVG